MTEREAREAFLDPLHFARRILMDRPWSLQKEIMTALAQPNASVAVKGCHASSKTYLAAEMVLWFIARYRKGIAVTTAPTDRQVEQIMWEEIRKARERARWSFPESHLKQLVLAEGNFAVGFATSQSAEGTRVQGYHAPHLLIVIDEAPGMVKELWGAIDGIRAGGDVRVLALGNPTIRSGPFYDIWSKEQSRWTTFTVDAYETPNFERLRREAAGDHAEMTRLLRELPEDHIAIRYVNRPYLVTPLWAKGMLQRHGELSPWYQARVRGQFPQYAPGGWFSRDWFEIVDHQPEVFTDAVRYWDFAATEQSEMSPDPDYAAGVLMLKCTDARRPFCIADVQHFRASPHDVEIRVQQTARLDTRLVPIRIEEEPGASGKQTISHFQRNILPGHAVYGDRVTGPQPLRVQPMSSGAQQGLISVVRGDWNDEFFEELEFYQHGAVHDDMVVAAAGAYNTLAGVSSTGRATVRQLVI